MQTTTPCNLTVTITRDLYERMAVLAKGRERSLSAEVRLALRGYLANLEAQEEQTYAA